MLQDVHVVCVFAVDQYAEPQIINFILELDAPGVVLLTL